MIKIKVFQLPSLNKKKFVGWELLSRLDNYTFEPSEYELIYKTTWDKINKKHISLKEINSREVLDIIFDYLNDDVPTDFSGHSLSVSDVILLDGEFRECYYCDDFSWKNINEYFNEFQKLN